jgi:hypothetical protein
MHFRELQRAAEAALPGGGVASGILSIASGAGRPVTCASSRCDMPVPTRPAYVSPPPRRLMERSGARLGVPVRPGAFALWASGVSKQLFDGKKQEIS